MLLKLAPASHWESATRVIRLDLPSLSFHELAAESSYGLSSCSIFAAQMKSFSDNPLTA